jgi:two-component system, cell cycle sensor histidine kinase and response regulator CckA
MSSHHHVFDGCIRQRRRALAWLMALLAAAAPSLVGAQEALDDVSLQLKYFHQFQFAGYYAADLCGFYQEERLAVDIRELKPDMQVDRELLEGRTTFATYSPLILERWAKGADLFLMAIIHQRNTHVMLVRENSPYHHLRDIISLPRERRVGPVSGMEVDLWLGLSQLGTDPTTFFPRRKNAGDLTLFIAGELDVLPALISNEPIRCRMQGVDVRPLAILPRNTAIPGDTLICTGQLHRTQPDLVERFRRASLRGWEYALSHPQELIDHILNHRHSRFQPQTRTQLEQEAAITAEYIDKDRVPLGNINQERLENIAKLLREAGLPGQVPSELIYRNTSAATPWLNWLIALLATGFIIEMLFLLRVNHRQRKALRETKSHYQNLFDSAEGFFVFHGKVTAEFGLQFDLASKSIEKILGHELSWYQQSRRHFIEQLHADDRPQLITMLQQVSQDPRTTLRLRLRLTAQDQSQERVLMLHATVAPGANGTTIDGVFIDFTSEAKAEGQRVALQEQLQSAQRNESLGLLASGVAHDFNNILSAIRGNAELLTDQIPQSHRYRLERLFQAVDRASGLVRQILAYSGRGRVESKPLDLAEELRQIDALIRHAMPKNVHTVLTLEEALPPVMFDPAQFQQVAVNLIVNAAESFCGKAGEVQVLLGWHQERIRLRVIDRGCGMDQATMARIFDPYFTTKNHGHGLGLAAVKGIIAGVSGSITCESVVESGTTFTVLLTPCVSAAVRKAEKSRRKSTDTVQFALVTDDDELVREITVETLTGLGYTCLQATGGQECLRILHEDRDRICLLVLDCRMPDIDGVTVLKRIRDQGDRLPVVLISGMINVDSMSPLLRDRKTKFLAKPFSQNQLAATIDTVFGSELLSQRDRDSSRTAIMVADVIRQRNEENNRRESGSSRYRKERNN